jgi:hypothetical protein
MNRKTLTTVLLIFILQVFIYTFSFSQETSSGCKVLKKEISGYYQGECKNGFAEGNGIAKGEDMYIGSFRKGLPDGKGVYKYNNGPTYTGNWKKGLKDGEGELRYLVGVKDSVVAGFWKADKFDGKVKKADDYKILNINNIEYYSIKRSDQDRNLIEISFERVMQKYIPGDLEFTFSSGYVTKDALTLSVHEFTCPVYFNIHFTIKTTGGTRECYLDFEVLTPGKYVVHVTNN